MEPTKRPCDLCLDIVAGVHAVAHLNICPKCERQLQKEMDAWEGERLVEREAERTAEELGMEYHRWYRADDADDACED